MIGVEAAPTGQSVVFGDVATSRTPFPYFVAQQVFERDVADALLSWLEEEAPWDLHEGPFFEQFETNLKAAQLPPACSGISEAATLAALRHEVGAALGVKLSDRVTISAHKLVPGQGIGVHNDAPDEGHETHRLVVAFGRSYDDRHGGHLIFLNSSRPDDLHRIFRPLHNTGVGFAMSDASYHAVTEVREGARYSVVFSFWDSRAREAETPRSLQDVAPDKVALLRETRAFETAHSGRRLVDHLAGTKALLADWACDEHVQLAGLFHSVYGTARFEAGDHRSPTRPRLRRVIGSEAEALAHMYASMDPKSLGIAAGGGRLLDQRGRPIAATPRQIDELLTIDAANAIEQLAHVEQPQAELVAEAALYGAHGDRFSPRARRTIQAAYRAALNGSAHR
jgi:hypothetical protein